MIVQQNGQSFDFTTEDNHTMHLVRRAGMPAAEFIRYALRFAASDEVLEYLEGAVNLLESIDGRRLDNGVIIDYGRDLPAMRTAIAKAKGG